MTTLELKGFDELKDDIRRLPAAAYIAGKIAMEQALLYLHGQIPSYPPPPSPGTFQFATARQRRWFFANLAEGKIESPYRRSGDLGRSFSTQIDAGEDGLTGSLGTNKEYAPWVVGPDHPGESIGGETMYQARVHEGRWWQFDEVMGQHLDEAERIFVETFFKEFEKRVEGRR